MSVGRLGRYVRLRSVRRRKDVTVNFGNIFCDHDGTRLRRNCSLGIMLKLMMKKKINKKIEKLAKASGYKHSDAVGDSEDYAYFDKEKFAELIIRECGKQVDLYFSEFYTGTGEHRILNHFGVKEK